MPESRFVSSGRLWPLLVYLAAAVVTLLAADVLLSMVGDGRWRTALALAWVVLLPIGGWLVWRRRA